MTATPIPDGNRSVIDELRKPAPNQSAIDALSAALLLRGTHALRRGAVTPWLRLSAVCLGIGAWFLHLSTACLLRHVRRAVRRPQAERAWREGPR